MAQQDHSIDSRLAQAISHPLRMRILSRLNEGVASPSDLAGALGEPLGNVSYHDADTFGAMLAMLLFEQPPKAPRSASS